MKFYVCFYKAAEGPIWAKFLDNDISHCLIYQELDLLGTKVYQCLEVLTNYAYMGLEIDEIGILHNRIRELHPELTMIEIVMDVDPLQRTSQLVHLNCVSLSKKLIGVRKWSIFTPKQLHDHLLTIGGTIYG